MADLFYHSTNWHTSFLPYIQTHLACMSNAKVSCYMNNKGTVLKARGKPALAEVNCHCKITSVMALDGVTSL